MRRRPLSDWVLYGMIVLLVLFLILAAVRAFAAVPPLIAVAGSPTEGA